jgi:hypothetical protein
MHLKQRGRGRGAGTGTGRILIINNINKGALKPFFI